MPTAYLTRAKNTGDILKAIQSAQAPERFTTKFLEGLGWHWVGCGISRLRHGDSHVDGFVKHAAEDLWLAGWQRVPA